MIKTLLAGGALCLAPLAALAADLPARMPVKAMPAVAPAFSWTGFYVGAHVGYGWGTHDTGVLDGEPKSKGVLGGVQAGYKFQTGHVVLGREADWLFSGIQADDRGPFTPGGRAARAPGI